MLRIRRASDILVTTCSRKRLCRSGILLVPRLDCRGRKSGVAVGRGLDRFLHECVRGRVCALRIRRRIGDWAGCNFQRDENFLKMKNFGKQGWKTTLWRFALLGLGLVFFLSPLRAQENGSAASDATESKDASSTADDSSTPIMFPHKEWDRLWLSGQANFISQWHPELSFAVPGEEQFNAGGAGCQFAGAHALYRLSG